MRRHRALLWMLFCIVAVVSVESYCGNTTLAVYEVTNGSFFVQDGDPQNSSTTYGSATCLWLITTTRPGHVVHVAMRWSMGQGYDRLNFHDGPSADSPLIGVATNVLVGGWTVPFASTGATLYVSLETDAFSKQGGFWMNFTSSPPPLLCPPNQYSDLGNVSATYYFSEPAPSVFGLQPYSTNRTCQWSFSTTAPSLFTNIPGRFGYLQQRPGDSFEVRRGTSRDGALLMARTSVTADSSYYLVLDAGTYSVFFVSHPQFLGLGALGFQFSIQVLPKPASTTNDPLTCSGNRTVVVSGQTKVFEPNPNSALTTITPQADHTCQWEFRAANSSCALTLQINSNFNTYFGNNVHSTLRIYDGNVADPAHLIGRETVCVTCGAYSQRVLAASGVALAVYHCAAYMTPTQISIVANQIDRPVECAAGSVITINDVTYSLRNPSIVTTQFAYSRDKICQWIFEAVSGKLTHISFVDVALNAGDALEITTNNVSARILTGVGGYDLSDLSFTNSRVMVTLTSIAGTRSARGFFLNVNRTDDAPASHCSGLSTFNLSAAGSVYDVAEPMVSATAAYYAPNLNCSWRITTGPGLYLSVYLTSPGFRFGDFLRIYDGNDDTASLLANITGVQSLPWKLGASTTSLYFTFKSGPGTVTSVGFSARVSATATPLYPSFASTCSGTGYVPILTGQSMAVSISAPNVARGVICTTLYNRTDWTGNGALTVQISPPNFGFFAPDRVRFYDGFDSSAPVIFELSPPTDGSGSGGVLPTSGYTQIATYSHYVRVEYQVAANAMSSGHLTASVGSTTTVPVPCSGVKVLTMNEFALSAMGINLATGVLPNMTCGWYVNAAPTAGMSFRINFHDYGGGYFGLPKINNQSYFQLFDGNTTAAPLLLDNWSDLSYSYQTSGSVLVLLFQSGPGPFNSEYGFTVNFKMETRAAMCQPYSSFYMTPGNLHSDGISSTVRNFKGGYYPCCDNVAFPVARTCVWEFFGVQGIGYRFNNFQLALGPSETVEIYGGTPTNRQLLASFDADSTVRLDPYYRPLMVPTYAYVIYTARAPPTTYGFAMIFAMVTMPLPWMYPAIFTPMVTETMIGSGLPSTYIEAPYRQAIRAWYVVGNDNKRYTGSAPPARAGTDKWMTLRCPPGSSMHVTVSALLEDGNITFWQSGQLVAFYTQGVYETLVVCDDLDVHFVINSASSDTFWSFDIALNYDALVKNLYCRRLADVPCYGSYELDSADSLTPLANCTIITCLTINYALKQDLVMPRLRMVQDVKFSYTNASVAFPALEAISGLFHVCGGNIGAEVNLPSLLFASGFQMLYPNTQRILAPLVHTISFFSLNGLGLLESVDLRSLTDLSTFSITQAPALTRLDLPAFRRADYFTFCTNGLIVGFDLSQLEYVVALTLDVTGPTTLSLPQLVNAASINVASGTLNSFSLPRAIGVIDLIITSAYNFQSLSLPLAVFVGNTFQVVSDILETASMPLLEAAQHFTFDGPAISTLVLPGLHIVTDIALINSNVRSFVAPSLTVALSTSLTNNFQLNDLDMCTLNQTSTLSVYADTEISCEGVNNMFSRLQPSFDIEPPQCSPVPAPFGCERFVRHLVNVSRCGYTLACIQASIDQAFKNRQHSVAIPPGTFTGCAEGPLNPGGKTITIVGASNGATVIDCQGSGRALVINQGEGRDLVIANMSMTNGCADQGGLILIEGSAPSLSGLSLSFSVAQQDGGALFVDAGAAPLLINTTIRACVAMAGDGGGLAVAASTIELLGVVFDGNSAGAHGGAMAVGSSAGGVPTLTSCVLLGNTAAQGGAVHSDGAVIISDSTFDANRASELGGALAAIAGSGLESAVVWYNISDVVFSSNSAPTGGAIYSFSGNIKLVDTRMFTNTADNDGGGVLITCSLNLRFVDGIVGVCDVTAIFDSVTATNNVARTGRGGALFASYAHVVVSGSTFTSNKAAEGDGGAVYATTTALTVMGSTMSANTVGGSGGAVYCELLRGGCLITGSTFTSNSAATSGGALFVCTAACVNVSVTDVTTGPALSALLSDNTLAADNAVGEDGYGALAATDPSFLSWLVAPDAQIISGEKLSQTGSVTVQVKDSFGSTVTLSKSVLAPSLQICDINGGSASQVTLQGAKTALLTGGVATFSGTTLVAGSQAATNTQYNLAARLSSNVVVSQPIYLAPCAPGYGYVDAGAIICSACQPGSASSADTGYVCQLCPVGYYSASVGAASCAACGVDTFSAAVGSNACQSCPLGQGAAAGSAQCSAAAKLESFILPVAGASAAALLVFIFGGLLIYRLARRQTMKKYYLDSDSTLRASGLEETPLMKEVRKIVVASTTTRIGGGAYADVYKARYGKQWIALKVLKKEVIGTPGAQDEFRREAVALSRLSHANNAGIIGLVFYLERNPMCLAMEFCEHGSLKRFTFRDAPRLSLAQKYLICAEAAAALAVVHANDIIHQDIKTDNMLLDEGMHVKVADFGISRVDIEAANRLESDLETTGGLDTAINPVFGSQDILGELSMGALDTRNPSRITTTASLATGFSSVAGSTIGLDERVAYSSNESINQAFTPQYCDPLRVTGDDTSPAFLRQADVFSFGMMMWSVYAQEEPYAGIAAEQVLRDLKDNPNQRPRPIDGMDAMYGQLMRRAWDQTPAVRPSFAELRDQLVTCLAGLPPEEEGGETRQLPPGYLAM